MACQRACKQGRDDKEIYKASSLHRFHISLQLYDVGKGIANSHSQLYHPYLACMLFGMPSIHPFTFLMFFFYCLISALL